MKIQALIADDKHPEGQRESFINTDFTSREAALAYINQILTSFNSDLHVGELPRRLVSFELVELDKDESFNLGVCHYLKGLDCPFEEGTDQRTWWQQGFDYAEGEYGDGEEGE